MQLLRRSCTFAAVDLSLPSPATRWNARLALDYVPERGKTVLDTRSHEGPLRVLKTLYPEGEAIAHTVIVHPPAGIASTDALNIAVQVRRGAHAVIATPGAQKWYRAGSGLSAAQSHTSLTVERDAVLEWVPHESIVFDGARGEQSLRMEVAGGGKLLAWEMTQWGRTTRGERFAQGLFSQRITLTRNGSPIWQENTHAQGGDPLLESVTGFGGNAVVGTLWVVGAAQPPLCLKTIRDYLPTNIPCGATMVGDELLCVKALAPEAEMLSAVFVQCRKLVRPFLCGRTGEALRIWRT
jgi:urease accessory protein